MGFVERILEGSVFRFRGLELACCACLYSI